MALVAFLSFLFYVTDKRALMLTLVVFVSEPVWSRYLCWETLLLLQSHSILTSVYFPFAVIRHSDQRELREKVPEFPMRVRAEPQFLELCRATTWLLGNYNRALGWHG